MWSLIRCADIKQTDIHSRSYECFFATSHSQFCYWCMCHLPQKWWFISLTNYVSEFRLWVTVCPCSPTHLQGKSTGSRATCETFSSAGQSEHRWIGGKISGLKWWCDALFCLQTQRHTQKPCCFKHSNTWFNIRLRTYWWSFLQISNKCKCYLSLSLKFINSFFLTTNNFSLVSAIKTSLMILIWRWYLNQSKFLSCEMSWHFCIFLDALFLAAYYFCQGYVFVFLCFFSVFTSLVWILLLSAFNYTVEWAKKESRSSQEAESGILI